MRSASMRALVVSAVFLLFGGDTLASDDRTVVLKGEEDSEFPEEDSIDEDAVFLAGVRVLVEGETTPVRNAVIRIQDTGRIVSRNQNGVYPFYVPAFGSYQLFLTATGFLPQGPVTIVVTNQSPFPLATIFLEPLSNASLDSDSDGDGLSDEDEVMRFNTNPAQADSDGDGMSDLFELENGFSPLDPSDGERDADVDLLSNVEEFRRNTNPRDPTDPQTIYFVSVRTGDDVLGDGSRDRPWQTINGAVANLVSGNGFDGVAPSLESPASLFLAPGAYDASVVLPDGLRIGATSAEGADIAGAIQGGRGAGFKNLRFIERDDKGEGMESTLLYLPFDGAVVENCDFLGLESSGVAGIVFDGPAHGRSAVTDCRFRQLKYGIEILGGLPKVRRNLFDLISDTGVVFRDNEEDKQEEPESNSFGDVRDPGSGYNVFTNVVNRAVLNERNVVIPMQNNDWGIDDLSQVEQIVVGPALVPPIIQPQGSILASAIFVTVWDKVSRDRIENGSTRLIVSTYNAITTNQDGVYPFPAVADGRYTIEVAAPGYEPDERTIDVAPGQVRSLSFPLTPETLSPSSAVTADVRSKFSENGALAWIFSTTFSDRLWFVGQG